MGDGGTLEEFVATMLPDNEPGRVCRYNSGDTQALGQLLVSATGRSITDYMQEKLVDPLGHQFAGVLACRFDRAWRSRSQGWS